MEERRLRLRAHRDMLLKQKNEQRQQELDEFKDKTTNKNDLHHQLKEIDQKAKAKHSVQQMDEQFDLENMEGPEYDKRLLMYRNLRDQLLNELNDGKEADKQARMNEINKKIQSLENQKKETEESEALKKQAMEQQRLQKNKGFLEGIKSFSVEDIQ